MGTVLEAPTQRPEPDRAMPIRWAIVGTANIARGNFLPALRTAGFGEVLAVGSRDSARARAFCESQGLEAAATSYREAAESTDVDAVYIALPNTLHLEWTEAALRAGRTVLCEKPLGINPGEVQQAVATAQATGRWLWEAFVFPFHRQMDQIAALIADGRIGEPREIVSHFHFPVTTSTNIRWQLELAGGALNDVGCYPLHLASLVFQAPPERAFPVQVLSSGGVDSEIQGLLVYPGGRRLMFSAGLSRPRDTTTRIIGSEGDLAISDPFHPGRADSVVLRRGRETQEMRLMGDEPTFTPMVRHIHAVIAGREQPRHLAESDARLTAAALDLVRREALAV